MQQSSWTQDFESDEPLLIYGSHVLD